MKGFCKNQELPTETFIQPKLKSSYQDNHAHETPHFPKKQRGSTTIKPKEREREREREREILTTPIAKVHDRVKA